VLIFFSSVLVFVIAALRLQIANSRPLLNTDTRHGLVAVFQNKPPFLP
jgi:hypothetical protein